MISEPKNKNPIVIGNTTELEVQYLLVKNGYEVFTPINDGCSVDLITIISGCTARVQIKTSRCSSTAETSFHIYLTNGRNRSKKLDKSKIDYLATTFEGNLYMVPIADVKTDTKLSLSTSDRKRKYYKEGELLLLASNYLFN